MEDLFIITWRYSDGSGSGCVRGYKTRETAEKDLVMLRDHGDTLKIFAIEEVTW